MQPIQLNRLTITSWLLATRPKTLTASLVPFIAGTALASAMGAAVSWLLLFSALASAIAIQIATNLFNDAFDFNKGADTAERLGPQRAIQNGTATAEQVYGVGMAFFAIALVAAIPLIIHGGVGLLLILLLSMLAGYSYTGGPYPLAYLGLGDLFVVIFYGWVSTMAAFWLQSGFISGFSFLLGAQIGLLCAVLIAVNNLRDVEGDAKVRKLTIPVRFGLPFARIEIALLVLLPFAMNFIWFFYGFAYAAALPWLLFPLALGLVAKIWKTAPSRDYNRYLAFSALLHLSFGALLTVGFMLD